MVDAMVDRLRGLITDELDVEIERERIAAETPLFQGGLDLDSFAIVELISLVEARFGFEFSPDDLRPEHFESLDTLARLVAARAPAGPP
jgi:acyl carrier protein